VLCQTDSSAQGGWKTPEGRRTPGALKSVSLFYLESSCLPHSTYEERDSATKRLAHSHPGCKRRIQDSNSGLAHPKSQLFLLLETRFLLDMIFLKVE